MPGPDPTSIIGAFFGGNSKPGKLIQKKLAVSSTLPPEEQIPLKMDADYQGAWRAFVNRQIVLSKDAGPVAAKVWARGAGRKELFAKLGLPIEEWMFFVVIVFVSVFTWEALKIVMEKKR